MSVTDKKLTLDAFHIANPNFIKERRQYTDRLRAIKERKANRNSDKNEVEVDITTYTGDCCLTLRTMVEVARSPMKEGHTYPTKDLVLMRIAEESNMYGYDLFIGRSDDQQIIATENVDGNISVSIKVLYSISSSSWKVVSYENNTENNTDEDNNGNVDNDLDDDIELDINSLGNELGGEFGTADDDNKNCELLYIYSLYIKFELSLTLVSLSIAKHRARTPFRGIVVFCATT
jgi:hypothetical protein